MRKIAFRAWVYDTKTKEFKMDYSPMIYDGECLGEFSMVRLNKAFAQGGNAEYEEKNKTIFMQFTGLKDSKGIEIFEGDIVSYYWKEQEPHIGNIFWYKYGYWKIKWKDFKGTESQLDDMLAVFVGNLEVIGNIFESPDLMTQNKGKDSQLEGDTDPKR